jgi:hypothetical protein
MPGFLEGEGGGGFQERRRVARPCEQLARLNQDFHSPDFLAERPCHRWSHFLVNDR